MVLCNKPGAGVLDRAERLGIETYIFDKEQFYSSGDVASLLLERHTDLVVLAGFLWLVPVDLLRAFPGKVINIHPALLPAYGGKGMYGDRVHAAVLSNREKESGITIHFVNEQYDEGDIIFQARCPVEVGDTPETLAARIHRLEYEHYPAVISGLLDRL